MKSITTKCFIAFALLCMAMSIKLPQTEIVQKRVDPKCVKSPGEFSNIAPDATQIISPKLASNFTIFIIFRP